MPDVTSTNSDTGAYILPDVGTLSYNGLTFGPLFESSISGNVVRDNAGRTTKYMDYVLTADGYVTLNDGEDSTDSLMANIRKRLTAQGGVLVYTGRGFGSLAVNNPGNPVRDVAWGPIPDLLEFQTLGAGRSAKVKWVVRTRIPEIAAQGGPLGPVLQFNEETTVVYDEDLFSHLTVKGTLEIPLTRITQSDRSITQTADQFRDQLENVVSINGTGIDLTRFRVTRRNISISRDKRTMEWDFAADELPHQGVPVFLTNARGSYSVRPSKSGLGLVQWNCTLRGTYTVPNGQPRRLAFGAFLLLLQKRMSGSINGNLPPNAPAAAAQNPPAPGGGGIVDQFNDFVGGVVVGVTGLATYRQLLATTQQRVNQQGLRPFLIDFSIDEGVYLDSGKVTFSATWRIMTTLSHILLASNLWRQSAAENRNAWATSIRSIAGSTSWLGNELDPAQDAIVDFGGEG